MNKKRASGRTVGGLRTLSLQAPAVTLLLLWMIVPLGTTLWFSFQHYNLLMPSMTGFAGVENYEYLLTDPALWRSMINTLLLVGWVLTITVVGGTLLAVLFQQEFAGRGIARVLAISPFFIMPTVSALVWKNMMMHPSNGVLAWLFES
ncbi:MAG: carbohydrate ABC transporter permease, partial [Halomonas sp.]